MRAAAVPFLIDPEGRMLFAAFHQAPGIPQRAVLFCAPFLHEQVRSFRLFALLADALAGMGCAVLRFDYFGTGDSGGDPEEFSLAGARADAERALAALRERVPAGPLAILGARAGTLVACPLAARARACELWLWQPVLDGGRYIGELQVRDDAERRSRFDADAPRRDPYAADPHSLLGFECGRGFRDELAHAQADAGSTGAAVSVLDDAARTPSYAARHVALDPSLHRWSDSVAMGSGFVAATVNRVARALLAS